jgi:hypothetical protein
LSHKNRGTDFTKIKRYICALTVLWMLGTVRFGLAQEPSTTPSENQDQKDIRKTDQPDQDQGGYRTLDVLITDQDQKEKPEAEGVPPGEAAIPIPIQAGEETKSLGAQSFVDDVFRNMKNRWGFSLGTFGAYTTALYEGNEPGPSSWITAFTSRTFLNFGTQASQLHFDVGAGYRYYNGGNSLNTWDYDGNANYSRQLAKNVSFQLSDQFTSSYNDSWSFVSLNSPINFDPSFSNEVLFNRQRIHRNSLTAHMGFGLTQKMQFGLFGAYRHYGYNSNSLASADAFEVGGSFGYRVKRWLSLTSNVSLNLSRGNDQSGHANVIKFEPGGLNFHLTRSWRAWASGGAQVAEYRGKIYQMESVNAGIGYTSRETSVSLTYQRGFTVAEGLSELLTSYVLGAHTGHPITSWMRVNVQAYYYRSREIGSNGALNTFSGGSGLAFALSQNLTASVNGFYQNQNVRNFSIQGLRINRITAYVGLQYFWPLRSDRGYN